MTVRALNRYKALILIFLALFFADKFVSGKLYFYIGPRFAWLAIVAVALFIMLAGSYNLVEPREEEGHSHEGHSHLGQHVDNQAIWTLMIVALPLALGVVIPAKPLGASAIANRGVTTDIGLAADSSDERLSIVPSERNLLDWVREMNNNPDPAALDGQHANLVGFVYRDPRFSESQFLVGRFTITCCVADALAIGVVVEADQAAQFETDSWVQVTGTFRHGEVNGVAMPILMADEVVHVQAPEQPYLYP